MMKMMKNDGVNEHNHDNENYGYYQDHDENDSDIDVNPVISKNDILFIGSCEITTKFISKNEDSSICSIKPLLEERRTKTIHWTFV